MWTLVKKWGVLSVVFLLPWQTRYIWGAAEIGGHASEFVVYSVYAVQVLILILGVVFLVDSVRQKDRKSISQSIYWSIGLLIYFFICWALGLQEAYGLIHISFIASALALLIILMLSDVSQKDLVLAFLTGLLLPIAFGIYQFIVGVFPASTILGIATRDVANLGDSVFILQDGSRWLRAYGSFPHPNIFAGYLVTGILALLFVWKEVPLRISYGFLALLIISLALTGSSAAWLAFICGLGVWFASRYFTYTNKNLKWVLPPLVCLVSFVPIVLQLLGFEGDSIKERAEFLSYWVSVSAGYLITGTGAGQYIFALADAVPGLDWWMYQPVHNIFLLVIAEVGLVGAGAITVFLGLTIRKVKPLPIAVFSAAFFLLAIFDHYLWSSWAGLVLVSFVLTLTIKKE